MKYSFNEYQIFANNILSYSKKKSSNAVNILESIFVFSILNLFANSTNIFNKSFIVT